MGEFVQIINLINLSSTGKVWLVRACHVLKIKNLQKFLNVIPPKKAIYCF